MKMRSTKDNSGQQQQKSNNENIMKRPLTLDLNKKAFGGNNEPPILSTPDVNKFKLESPELENYLLNGDTLQTPSLQTPTPSGIFPAPVNNNVTMEQENYAKGFEDALKNLHNNDVKTKTTSAMPTAATTGGMSGGGITTFAQDESNLMLQIKEEPQQIPVDSENLMNPIDMASQETIKLERKRQRNRVAASKCRKRKLERISKLEDRVKILKVENGELGSVLTNLRQHVFELKEQIISHHNSGCHIAMKT